MMAGLAAAFLAGRHGRELWSGWFGPTRFEAWSSLEPAPLTRFESAVAVFDGRVYLFGGFRNADIQASSEVWVYDPRDQSWTRKTDMPSLVTHMNLVVLNDTGWIAGGFLGDNPGPATEQVWRYDRHQDRWSPGPPLPEPRGGGALAAMGGRLHYVGGFGADRHGGRAEHWVLGPADSAWVAAAPLPKPRGHLGAAVVDGQLYAIGGAETHDPLPNDLPWVHRYDPTADRWVEVAPLPFPRSHFEQSVLVRNGRLVIVGGRSTTLAHDALDDVTEYDPVTDRWRLVNRLPRPLHSPFAAEVDGRMVVGFGGQVGGRPDNTSIWMERPALAWTPASPMPAALAEVAAAAIGERLYVVGDSARWTLALDLGTGRWAPAARHAVRPARGDHHAAEVWNGQLYLFGGMNSGENMVQIYDPVTDLWRFGPNLPHPAGSMASALIGGSIYLAGGIGEHGTRPEALRFDPVRESWDTIAPMPLPRNHAAAGTDGRRFYVFGGRGPGSGDHNTVANGFDEVQIYDPITDAWAVSGVGDSAPARMPQARGGMGKAVYDGREFWIFGGETLDGPGANAAGVYDRVDIYDPVTNRWRSGPPMPAPRHGIFPVLLDRRVLIFGGGARAGPSASALGEMLDLQVSRVPTPP